MTTRCRTVTCLRKPLPASPYCAACFAIVLASAHQPFVPAWRRRDLSRDESRVLR